MLEEFIYSAKRVEEGIVSKAGKHIPEIVCPDVVKAGEPFEVKVSIEKHPNMLEHSIRHVELFFVEEGRSFNPIKIAEVQFVPEYSEAEVKLKVRLKKSGSIVALAYCNLHGLWEGMKEVKVE